MDIIMTDSIPIFLGVGEKIVFTPDEAKHQKVYNEIFTRNIGNIFPHLNKVLSGRRISVRTTKHDEYCFTHIVGFNDYTLIELGKEYGFPRGVCFVWKSNPACEFTFINILDFVPKFGNEVDNKKDMRALYSTVYFMKKLSGSLIYVKAISPNKLVVSAKNSMFNEFTNRFIEVMGHLLTLEFVNDLYKRNWTVCFEFIADRLGGDHASRSSIDIAVAIVVTLNRPDLTNFCTDKLGVSTVVSWEETAQVFNQHNIPYLPRYYVQSGPEWDNWIDNVLIPNRDFFTNSMLTNELNKLIGNGIVKVVGGNYDHAHSDILEGLIVVLSNGHRFKFKFARYTLMTMAIRVAISKGIINSGQIHLPEWLELSESYSEYWTPSNQSFFKSFLNQFAIEIVKNPTKIEESTYLDVCEPIVTKLWEHARTVGLSDGLAELKQLAPQLIVYPIISTQSPNPTIPYVDKIPKNLPPSTMVTNGGRVLRWAFQHGYRVDWSYWDNRSKQAPKMKQSLEQILKEAQKEMDNQVKVNCHVILMSALPGSGKSFLMNNIVKLWNRRETLIIVDGDSVKSISSGTQIVNMIVKDKGTVSNRKMCIKDITYQSVVMIIDKNTPSVDDTARGWKNSKELKHWNIKVSNLRMSGLKSFRPHRDFLLNQMRNRPGHSVKEDKVEEVLDLFYQLYEDGSPPSFRSREYATTIIENGTIRFKTPEELEKEVIELGPFFDWPEQDRNLMMQARFKVGTDLKSLGVSTEAHVTIYWGSVSDKPSNLDEYKERTQLVMTHLYDQDGFVVLYTVNERQPASGTLFHVTIKHPRDKRPVDAGLTVTKLQDHNAFKLETPIVLDIKYCEFTT